MTEQYFVPVRYSGDPDEFKLSHVCMLGLSGSFAINVIDNLIIVHHQSSKVRYDRHHIRALQHHHHNTALHNKQPPHYTTQPKHNTTPHGTPHLTQPPQLIRLDAALVQLIAKSLDTRHWM